MLHLAKDGIFPITKDKDGKLLKELPASGLHVQERFRAREN